ncbi:aspartyl-phosphate phosphatase Spo0E family protein [Paenibacillus agilis]
MLNKIEYLRMQLHKTFEAGLPLAYVRMIRISQNLDRLLTEYYIHQSCKSNSLNFNSFTSRNVITLGGEKSQK